MINRKIAGLISLLFVVSLSGVAEAKILSKSEPEVTQLKILRANSHAGRGKPTAWGVDSSYIGPGEIRKLRSVDIYLDSEHRISAVKISRESNLGDIITILVTNVVEISIETVKEGIKKLSQKTIITVHTGDSLTFP